jgi:hypothetical protein
MPGGLAQQQQLQLLQRGAEAAASANPFSDDIISSLRAAAANRQAGLQQAPEEVQWLAAQAAEALNRVASLAAMAASSMHGDLRAMHARAQQVSQLVGAVQAAAAGAGAAGEQDPTMQSLSLAAKAAESLLHDALAAVDASGGGAEPGAAQGREQAQQEEQEQEQPKSLAEAVLDLLAGDDAEEGEEGGARAGQRRGAAQQALPKPWGALPVDRDQPGFDADLNLYAEYDDDDDGEQEQQQQRAQQQGGDDPAFEAALAALGSKRSIGRGEAEAITAKYLADAAKMSRGAASASRGEDDDEGALYGEEGGDYNDYGLGGSSKGRRDGERRGLPGLPGLPGRWAAALRPPRGSVRAADRGGRRRWVLGAAPGLGWGATRRPAR